MSDDSLKDAYWKLYAEQRTHVRHHEAQRSIVASSVVAIAGGCTALVTFDKGLTLTDVPLSLLVTALGVFGALFSTKQWERSMNARTIASICLEKIDGFYQNQPLESVQALAAERHDPKFKVLRRMSVRAFWQWLYVFIAVVGMILVGIEVIFPTIV